MQSFMEILLLFVNFCKPQEFTSDNFLFVADLFIERLGVELHQILQIALLPNYKAF